MCFTFTFISKVTEENLSEAETGPWVVVTPSSPYSESCGNENTTQPDLNKANEAASSGIQHPVDDDDNTERTPKSTDYDVDSNANYSAPFVRHHYGSNKSTSSTGSTSSTSHLLVTQNNIQMQQASEHSSSSHPIDANVVVTLTGPSVDLEDKNDEANIVEDSVDYAANIGGFKAKKRSKSAHVKSGTSSHSTPGSRKYLVRQPSHIVDTEGFSDTVLGEINQSMTPFKDIHNESYFRVPHEEVNLEDVSFHHLNQGFTDTLDTEIVTSIYADNAPRGSRGSTPSHSPSSKRKESEVGRKSSAADKLRSSHLWSRRSKKKTLELIIPNRNGIHQMTDESTGAATSHLTVDKKPSKKSKKKRRSSSAKKRAKDKLDTVDNGSNHHNRNSDSSATSGASDVDVNNAEITSPDSDLQSGIVDEEKDSNSLAAEAPHRQFSFSGAASAMNAFRKMMHRKEPTDMEEEEHTVSPSREGESSSAARRRWKMIFNVTKFETIVRTPQVPEVMDESLFYNQNISHPKTRHRLVSFNTNSILSVLLNSAIIGYSFTFTTV